MNRRLTTITNTIEEHYQLYKIREQLILKIQVLSINTE